MSNNNQEAMARLVVDTNSLIQCISVVADTTICGCRSSTEGMLCVCLRKSKPTLMTISL